MRAVGSYGVAPIQATGSTGPGGGGVVHGSTVLLKAHGAGAD
jgi:hypothetical protein